MVPRTLGTGHQVLVKIKGSLQGHCGNGYYCDSKPKTTVEEEVFLVRFSICVVIDWGVSGFCF